MAEQDTGQIGPSEVDLDSTARQAPEGAGADSIARTEKRELPRHRPEQGRRVTEDHARFAEYARTHSLQLRNELVIENERIVHFLLARFPTPPGVSRDDLVQAGYVGLVRAVERFDPEAGCNFMTYAAPTIMGAVLHHVRDQSGGLKVPRRLRELSIRMRSLRRQLEQRLGRCPTPGELAVAAGISEERVLAAMEADQAATTCSLETPLPGMDGHGTECLAEVLGAEEPALEYLRLQDELRKAVERLEPRLRQLIEGRYYGEASQKETAAALGISQMHVSRLERRALEQLRELLANDGEPR